jgi:hypothetical protein
VTHLVTIVSGGQTGVDRAALDVAMELGLPTGGWVPNGRIAEDGRIPDAYLNLRETDTAEYSHRTFLNVRDSDATLLLSHGPLTGGSLFTMETATKLGRPSLHVDLTGKSDKDAAREVQQWLTAVAARVLNVAGPRASGDPTIGARAAGVLRMVLGG